MAFATSATTVVPVLVRGMVVPIRYSEVVAAWQLLDLVVKNTSRGIASYGYAVIELAAIKNCASNMLTNTQREISIK